MKPTIFSAAREQIDDITAAKITSQNDEITRTETVSSANFTERATPTMFLRTEVMKSRWRHDEGRRKTRKLHVEPMVQWICDWAVISNTWVQFWPLPDQSCAPVPKSREVPKTVVRNFVQWDYLWKKQHYMPSLRSRGNLCFSTRSPWLETQQINPDTENIEPVRVSLYFVWKLETTRRQTSRVTATRIPTT